jgi:thiol-disulfide isomerase/thioredoxin
MQRARPIDTFLPRGAPAVLALGGIILLGAAVSCAPAAPVARLGGPAPAFALPGLDGRTVRLADFQGRPVVINFWATWCVPCREEMPLLQEAYERYRERGLVVIAVDIEEPEAVMRRWVEQGGFTLTFVRDPDGSEVKRYNVTSAPTTYFVGPDGVIRDLKLGALSRAELDSKLAALFAASS